MTGPAKRYWLYVDDVTSSARVHEARCGFCNYGAGMKRSREPDNRWCGPFSLADAVQEARRIGKRDTAGCGSCLPDLRIS